MFCILKRARFHLFTTQSSLFTSLYGTLSIFFFAEASVETGSLTLDARESHHLMRVLRAKSGETVEVLDGKGTRYLGRIATVDAKAVRVEVDSFEKAQAPRPRVTLFNQSLKVRQWISFYGSRPRLERLACSLYSLIRGSADERRALDLQN